MTLSKLDVHLLNSLCDDYENVESITSDLELAMSSVPGAEAIVDRLRFLWSEGLIEVYKYDVSKTEFCREEKAADVDFRTDWYFITQRGREELDLNWGEEEAG